MTYTTGTPETSGPSRDGSRALARESKYGQTVTFVLSVAALAAAGWLGNLDLGTIPGWAASAVAVAVSTLAGTLTAWATRNRPRAIPLRRVN